MVAGVLAVLPLVGCAAPDSAVSLSPQDDSAPSASQSSDGESGDVNFRLLVSDEPNAIGDFDELWATISGIVFTATEGSGADVAIPLDAPVSVNLAELIGEDAIAIWEGYLPEGEYTQVSLDIDGVVGLPAEAQAPDVEVQVPGNGRLPLDLSFTVGSGDDEEENEGAAVDFVFDITVNRTDNGQYELRPELDESGPERAFRALENARERISFGGPPEWVDPTSPGKPDWVPEDDEDYEGPPEWVQKPESTGKPDSTPDDDNEDGDGEDGNGAVSASGGSGQSGG
ncbi:MAG: DUF4382 domain-containing protein, partial [Chloroflexota bacterium]